MKLTLLSFISFCIVLCGCSGNNKSTNAITLALKFPAGSHYVYVMDSRQTIQQQMGGMNSEISQQMQLQSSYRVANTSNANKKLTINYDRFYIKSSSNGMVMEYDSNDSTKQPPELSGAGNIVNHPFSILVNTKGEILKVENALMDDSIERQFTDSSIRQMMEQSLNIYPEKPVKIGDNWQRTYNTNIGFMDMQVVSDYQLISIANDVAHVAINATIRVRHQTTHSCKTCKWK